MGISRIMNIDARFVDHPYYKRNFKATYGVMSHKFNKMKLATFH